MGPSGRSKPLRRGVRVLADCPASTSRLCHSPCPRRKCPERRGRACRPPPRLRSEHLWRARADAARPPDPSRSWPAPGRSVRRRHWARTGMSAPRGDATERWHDRAAFSTCHPGAARPVLHPLFALEPRSFRSGRKSVDAHDLDATVQRASHLGTVIGHRLLLPPALRAEPCCVDPLRHEPGSHRLRPAL
jgi:hypothetical protein